MSKRLTNVQFVKRIMETSKHGALMQAFVIDALGKHAEMVANADPAKFDSGLLSGQAWVGCAKELRDAINANYG